MKKKIKLQDISVSSFVTDQKKLIGGQYHTVESVYPYACNTNPRACQTDEC